MRSVSDADSFVYSCFLSGIFCMAAGGLTGSFWLGFIAGLLLMYAVYRYIVVCNSGTSKYKSYTKTNAARRRPPYY